LSAAYLVSFDESVEYNAGLIGRFLGDIFRLLARKRHLVTFGAVSLAPCSADVTQWPRPRAWKTTD